MRCDIESSSVAADIGRGTHHLSVALLMECLEEAEQLSLIFRKTGVVPHFYQDLKDFWGGVLESPPALAIIDLRMFSQEDLKLSAHPMVANEALPLVFFCPEGFGPLLYTSYDIFSLGNIREDEPYEGQVKAVLRRFNYIKKLEDDIEEAKLEHRKEESKLVKFVSMGESLKEANFYHEYLDTICNRFNFGEETANDFWAAVEMILESMEEVVKFSALELSPNGQRLVSPMMFHERFEEIPSLWLGKTCSEGIEFLSQNMASQVVLDILGGDLMSLVIRGKSSFPEKMLFLRIGESNFLENFSWSRFEQYLCGLNCYFELQNSTLSTEGSLYSPWEFFSMLDDRNNPDLVDEDALPSEQLTLINMNFSKLVGLIRDKQGRKFYWNRFFQQFFARFEEQENSKLKFVCMGVENVGLCSFGDQGDELLAKLEDYASRYSYWRHFDDAELILSKDVKPEIKIVPPYSYRYMQFLQSSDSVDSSPASGKQQVFYSSGVPKSV